MSARAKIPLSDFITLQRGFDLPTARRKEGNVPVIASTGIAGYHNEAKVKGPGVVIGRSGSIGGGQYAANDFWPLNTTLWVKDFKGNNPRFTYYLLKGIDFTRFNAGAGVPTLNRNHIASLRVSNFSPAEQAEIASILSAYDDLIENNRRRIQLLEESARLLYREWFVRLSLPGHERVKIIDGVPEGWEKKQVKHVLGKVKRPRKIKKSEFLPDGPIPCVDQSRDFIGGYTDEREAVIDEGKPIIVFGDHTRILKFVDFPFACGADGTQLIVSNNAALSQEYLYFSLDAVDLSNYFYARHFKFLKDQYIPIPTESLIATFTASADPVMKQVKTLRELTRKLAKARYLLLPRLMNGEIKV